MPLPRLLDYFFPQAPGRNPNGLILHNIGVNAKTSHLVSARANKGLEISIHSLSDTAHTARCVPTSPKHVRGGVDIVIVLQHISPFRQLHTHIQTTLLYLYETRWLSAAVPCGNCVATWGQITRSRSRCL